jgi:hypothetical protein
LRQAKGWGSMCGGYRNLIASSKSLMVCR